VASVSKLVRDAVYARLTAAWATNLAGIVAEYTGVPATDKTKLSAIAWDGSKKQVFQGQLNVDSLESTSPITYPLVILFTSDITHDGAEKFVTFSGSVALTVEFHYTWRKSAALPNFDEFMDLIEETLIAVFHDRNWVGALSAGLSYSGQMTAQRGQVQENGENWVQAVSFRLIFGVDV
jgi:hypothetical protein